MNYIPIEQMQDKWLVGVVGIRHTSSHLFSLTPFSVQPQTSQYAWREELCNGSLCKRESTRQGLSGTQMSSFQATSKDGKEGGIEIIQPPPNCKPGDRVYFEGAVYEGT